MDNYKVQVERFSDNESKVICVNFYEKKEEAICFMLQLRETLTSIGCIVEEDSPDGTTIRNGDFYVKISVFHKD